MATLTVRGEAVVPGRPNEALVSLELAAERATAEAYADGLGPGVGAVVEAREPWAGGDPRRERAVTFAAVDAEIPVDPGELEVRAAVDVTFALEQP